MASTTIESPARERAEVPAHPERRLFALIGEVDGNRRRFPIRPGSNLVGSHPKASVFLRAEGVSSRHALILYEAGRLRLIDLQSTNGTFVDGNPVRSSEVEEGDTIWFGPLQLRLEAVDGDDATLAFEVGDSFTEEPFPAQERTEDEIGEMTRVVWHPQSRPEEAWSVLVRHFVDRLINPSQAKDLRLLKILSALNLTGTCVLLHRPDTPLVHLGTWGTQIPQRILDRVAEAWRGRSGSEVFRSDSEATFYSTEIDNGGLSIILCGDLDDGAGFEPLLVALLALFKVYRLERPNVSSLEPETPVSRSLRFPAGYIIGASAPQRRLFAQMESLADTELPVLICGATGVGKEAIAQTLHLSSRRKHGPFVAINCAAIPAELLEAELFGIGKGVATGVAPRTGLFAKAQGGTFLLDEVGEMPLPLQAKLLRVLQENEITPLGARPFTLDVRILAATNVEINDQVEKGRFRQDLFYRLAGAVLTIPDLRERRTDIPCFIAHFLRRYSSEAKGRVRGITVAAQDALMAYHWPGNIRELQHEVRRLVYSCVDGEAISLDLVSEAIRKAAPDLSEPAASSDRLSPEKTVRGLPTLDLDELESLAIEEALQRTDGAQAKAAELLGLSRFALRRRLKR